MPVDPRARIKELDAQIREVRADVKLAREQGKVSGLPGLRRLEAELKRERYATRAAAESTEEPITESEFLLVVLEEIETMTDENLDTLQHAIDRRRPRGLRVIRGE